MIIKNIYNDSVNFTNLNKIKTNSILETTQNKKSFFNYIIDALNDVSLNEKNTEKKIHDFQSNKSNISLNDIMIDLQKSSISLQLLIQIRNKIMLGYQEIMNMQI
ncbi:MAG: flagellar hook-basal body complex protein FliE [Buchnera aphidicola (Chaetogeoica yunlongensis)]